MDSGGQETHRFRFDAPAPSPRPPMAPAASPPREPLASAITRTRDWLLAQQADEGYWVGELEGDSILQSEYILLLAWLNTHDDAPEWLPERIRRLANRLHRQQLPGGGWSLFPGGPLEISGSVKAYLAMKIAGASPDAPWMQRARRAILSAGGAEHINSFTRYYLALLGILRYDQCPAVPPELVLIPHWVPLNIYDMSAWSRTIFVPQPGPNERYRSFHDLEASRLLTTNRKGGGLPIVEELLPLEVVPDFRDYWKRKDWKKKQEFAFPTNAVVLL